MIAAQAPVGLMDNGGMEQVQNAIRDVILTGMPRSGTTLACSLLNRSDRVLALVEPMDVGALAGLGSAGARREAVLGFCAQVRADIAAGRPVRQGLLPDGRPDNTFAEAPGQGGLRQSVIRREKAVVGRVLAPGYRLVIKHPNAFTALLPALKAAFDCFALVRNPLAALGSWQTLKLGLRKGRAPMAERLDAELAAALDACPDALARQVCLVNWYFRRYAADLPAGRVLRYEDLVAAPGEVLGRIDASVAGVQAALSPRNRNPVYDRAFMRRALAALLGAPERAWAAHYDEDELAALVDGPEQSAREPAGE